MALSQDELLLILKLRDEASKNLQSAMGGMKTSTVAWGAAIGALAADAVRQLVGVAKQAAGAGISFNAMKEQATIAFTKMLGDGAKAQKFLNDLQSFAAKTPFEFPDLLVGARRLMAMGFAAGDVLPIMTDIGDAVAAMGGGADMINRVTIAFGQMQARGKTAAQEMLQLTEAGIPAWRYLAESIGKSIPEAMKMVENGMVSAQQTITAVREGIQREFGGMMAEQALTYNGLISTLKDNARIFAGEVTQPLFTDMKQVVVDFMKWYESNKYTIIGTSQEILLSVRNLAIGFIKGIRDIWNFLVDFHNFLVDHRAAVIVELGLIIGALVLAFGPGGTLILALGAFITFLGLWEGDWEDLFLKLPEPVAEAVASIISHLWILTDFMKGFITTSTAIIATFLIATGKVTEGWEVMKGATSGEAWKLWGLPTDEELEAMKAEANEGLANAQTDRYIAAQERERRRVNQAGGLGGVDYAGAGIAPPTPDFTGGGKTGKKGANEPDAFSPANLAMISSFTGGLPTFNPVGSLDKDDLDQWKAVNDEFERTTDLVKRQLTELNLAMMDMDAQGLENTAEFAAMTEKAAAMKDTLERIDLIKDMRLGPWEESINAVTKAVEQNMAAQKQMANSLFDLSKQFLGVKVLPGAQAAFSQFFGQGGGQATYGPNGEFGYFGPSVVTP